MSVLAEMLEKAKTDGSVGIAELRTEFKTEFDTLQDINATTLGDWMLAKDKLAGETAEAKQDDFTCRQKALQATQQYITKNDAARAEMENLGIVMPERKFAKNEPVEVRVQNPLAKSLGSVVQDAGIFNDWDFGSKREFKGKMSEVIHQLKAVTYTGFPGQSQQNTTGLLPTDRIVDIYPMQLEPLDYFTMRAEPGAYIRYVEPEDPIRPDSATGNAQYAATRALTGDAMSDIPAYGTVQGARIRIRGSRLGERAISRPTITIAKQSEGVMTFVNREDINDNPQVWQKTADQLMLDVRQLLMWQLFYGNGGSGATQLTTGAWNGFDAALTIAPGTNTIANFNQGNSWHNTVAVHANDMPREPLAFLEELYVRMRYAGMNPTAIFLGASDWTRIRQSQRSYRYQNPDFMRYPNGEVQGIPMVVNPFAAANTLHVCDTRPDVIEIVLGEDIQSDVSEDFDFGNNRTTMRVVVYGNVAIYKKFGLVKVTATNNFDPQTSP